MNRHLYHTQERRNDKSLNSPIKCTKKDAWLGEAYYFWVDRKDAIKWGKDFKRNTGIFEVYKSEVNCENVLDTVFNEEHYNFWLIQIEKVASVIKSKTKKVATIKQINEYFKKEDTWKELSGIFFQDIPESNALLKVNNFYYRKRIQLALYKLDNMLTFESILTSQI